MYVVAWPSKQVRKLLEALYMYVVIKMYIYVATNKVIKFVS